MSFRVFGTCVAACFAAAGAQAIVVDGQYDATYGAATAHVSYQAGAPESNFGDPQNVVDTSSYDVYLTSDANNVYGYLRAAGDASTVGTFANVYFDTDPANGNGSDIGFELSTAHQTFFVAGGSGPQQVTGITVAQSSDGLGLEFSIPDTFFTVAQPGREAYPLATPGSDVVFRLSQSFGYSVAGGASYGDNRLGRVTIGGATAAVPEPASWAMMVGGFGLAGAALRRRKTQAALA